MFGAAVWSQVVVGWRWEAPSGRAVAVAMVLMSAAALVAAGLAVLAAGPLLWALARAALRGRADGLLRPSLLAAAGATVLVVGSRHFENGWPGTGGHRWAYHRLVPTGIEAFAWAASRGVTSYWMHPGALMSFSVGEVAWMAVSPLIVACVVVALVKVVRRVEFSPRILRYEATLARATVAVMLVFLAGAACWIIADGVPGPTGIYRVGTVDVIGLVAMVTAWAVACQAALGRPAIPAVDQG